MLSRFKFNEHAQVKYNGGELSGIVVQRSFFRNKPYYLIASGGKSFTAFEHELVHSTSIGRNGGRGR